MKICPCFRPQFGSGWPSDSLDRCLKANTEKRHKLAVLFSILSRGKGSCKQKHIIEEINKYGEGKNGGYVFKFRELINATDNFSMNCMIGEGGFGRVYRGFLSSLNQEVAVKRLDRNGMQGTREFLAEVMVLSMAKHPNLINLIGYCLEDDQKLLVYHFMPNGSLEDHLFDLDEGKPCLDWSTRMRIVHGAAKGLAYLHENIDPIVIYRDFKAANILLDEHFNPKLSDFGLARVVESGDKDLVSTRVMGTYGYCAPEYVLSGRLTTKSDVYSFGVVLLEIISGRRAIDTDRPSGEQNLISWAEPLLKDKKMFNRIADPMMEGNFPIKELHQVLAIATMCLQEEADTRPLMADVVKALECLGISPKDEGDVDDKDTTPNIASDS